RINYLQLCPSTWRQEEKGRMRRMVRRVRTVLRRVSVLRLMRRVGSRRRSARRLVGRVRGVLRLRRARRRLRMNVLKEGKRKQDPREDYY
ncbi:hypothetical protein LTR49_028623, partial [Elasticomyces elasticus]